MATEAEIQQMYQDLFGRQAKQEGLSYWQQQGLEGDQLREALVNAAKVNSNNPNDYYSYLKSQDSYMGLVPNQVTGDQYTSARNAYRSALGTQGAGSPNFYYDPATRASLDDGATYLNADERNTNWLLAQQLAGAGKTQDEIAAALRQTEIDRKSVV